MYAVGATAHWLVVLESFFGPFVLVAARGLLIARLTRPRMRLRFSESAVVAPYEGGRGLMFRMVNVQPGELSDVQVRVNLALFEEVGRARASATSTSSRSSATRWSSSRCTGRSCTRSPRTARCAGMHAGVAARSRRRSSSCS